MRNTLPELEPSRLGRIRQWIEEHDVGFEVFLIFGCLLGGCAALVVSIASFYPTSSGGLGSHWWLFIILVPLTIGVLALWYNRGPDYTVQIPGSHWDSDSAYSVLEEMRRSWLGLPMPQRGELLPLMRSAYVAAQTTKRDASPELLERSEVLAAVVKEVKRAAELEKASIMIPDTVALEEARVVLAALRETNDVTEAARKELEKAYRELLDRG